MYVTSTSSSVPTETQVNIPQETNSLLQQEHERAQGIIRAARVFQECHYCMSSCALVTAVGGAVCCVGVCLLGVIAVVFSILFSR